MPRAPKALKPPVLQILFEPFPDPQDRKPWDREGCEAFAGTYWFDALTPTGELKPRGFRAKREGCTLCRRADDNPRAHWQVANDPPTRRDGSPFRPCGMWKWVESVVKHFGGWKCVHYAELSQHEGLQYQELPQRRRTWLPCAECGGTGFGAWDNDLGDLPRCPAGCSTENRGHFLIPDEGPLLPDRWGLSAVQRRIRSSAQV